MKARIPLNVPREMNNLLTGIAEKKGISKNGLIIEIFWEWKRKLNRNELIKMFGEEQLTEMEISIYGERKRNESK